MGQRTLRQPETNTYEWVNSSGGVWYFRFHYNEPNPTISDHRFEIPMDIRGNYARSMEQLDWVENQVALLGLKQALTCMWDSAWSGDEASIRAFESALQKAGGHITQTKVRF